ncbi:Uncharacterized protein dnm_070320 [Desulfonema magnum]|uniref:Uncharacterized protein n=1 Tax=Desulfonema magnum TaxID=45655 RepID=A0A975BST2_9BACT|nr:Uncharacterized protein dnm_070320 [Desulfonema magnum]
MFAFLFRYLSNLFKRLKILSPVLEHCREFVIPAFAGITEKNLIIGCY